MEGEGVEMRSSAEFGTLFPMGVFAKGPSYPLAAQKI